MKKFLSKNKNVIILLFISAAVSFYLMLPIIMYGTRGIFFELDPDAHYIGNVISYIKSHQISYINHPATPTIMAYVYALIPFRFYTKFVLHTNFIDWFILHSEIVYLYLRFFQAVMFGVGLYLFSLATYRITRSLILSVSSIFALFTFNFFPDIALHIRSETTSFLITAIWLLIFVNFIKSGKQSQNFLLAAISGLAIANKFTNIFYFLATLSLIFLVKGISGKKRLLLLFVDLVTGLVSFIFFTWPIRDKYNQIIQYIFDFFPQSGVLANKNSLFNLQIYLQNITSLVSNEFWSSLIVILSFIMVIYLFSKRRDKLFLPIYFFALPIFFGILIFVRYPLNYYQLTNFAGIIFVLHVLLRKYSNHVRIIFFVIFFFASIKPFESYYPQVVNAINQSMNLDNFIASHPSKYGTIWEAGRSRDFALLWGNSWSGAGYSENLARLRPDLLFEIYFYENYLNLKQNIFNVCWDKFYMQENYLNKFKDKYQNNHFTYTLIPKTGNMYIVERDTCEP